MTEPKVLIGIPLSKFYDYCADELIASIKSFDYPNFEVLICDFSNDEEYHKKFLEQGFKVVRNTEQHETKVKSIVSNRNKIIDFFLKNDYDYLFFLDSDVIIPPDALSRLVNHKKECIGGLYLGIIKNPHNGEMEIYPIIYGMTSSPEELKTIPIIDVPDDKIMELGAIGFGCTLFNRDYWEKVKIIFFPKSSEDVPTCYSAREKFNIKTYVDTSIKCIHIPKPDIRLDYKDIEKQVRN